MTKPTSTQKPPRKQHPPEFRQEALMLSERIDMAAVVIALDITEHCHPHYFPADKTFTVDTFHLQRVEDAFHAGAGR